MTTVELFEQTKDLMANRDHMIIDNQFINRANQAILMILGRTIPMTLVTFEPHNPTAVYRRTNYGFDILKHETLTIDKIDSQVINLDEQLQLALMNRIASQYEPMMSKQFMIAFWEAVGSNNYNVANSPELIQQVQTGRPRAFP